MENSVYYPHKKITVGIAPGGNGMLYLSSLKYGNPKLMGG